MKRKKKRLKSEKKNAAYKSIWGNRPRNTNYKLIGPKIESVKMNSKRSKKNSGITRPSFSRLKLTSSVMTGSWKKLFWKWTVPRKIGRSFDQKWTAQRWRIFFQSNGTVHFHSFRTVHFHVLNRPDSVDLDRPLLFLADRLHSFFGQSRLGPSTFTSDHFDKNAKHDLYFRRINKQKQKVMAKEARLNASLNNVRVEEESDSDEDPEGKDHPLLIIGKKTRRLDISVPVMWVLTPTHENIKHVVPTLDMNEHGVNPKVETQNPLKLVLPKGLLTDQQKKRRRQTSSDQDGSTFGGIYLIHHPLYFEMPIFRYRCSS